MVVNHKIQPKHFEVVEFALYIQPVKVCPDRICSHLLHSRQDIRLKAILLAHKVHVKISLKLVVAELVTWLVLTVIVSILLDGIVGQVDQVVIEILQIVLVAACTDVTLLVPEGLEIAVDACDHHVVPDIELSVVIQKRAVYVALNDVCP